MNFKDGIHFQDGCNGATSCVGIIAQLLLVDRVSVRTIAVTRILIVNKFCKVLVGWLVGWLVSWLVGYLTH